MQARDEELMMEYRDKREPEAMVALFRRYRRPLYAYLARRTGSPSRAEDLVQEVFAALMTGADRYEPSGSFKAYIYRIAANLSAKEWRSYRRRVQLASEPVSGAEPADEVLDGEQAARAVKRALLALDDEQREPILLREYQGLSYAEIATVLDLPAGTVKSRIARGKLALRRALLGGRERAGAAPEAPGM
ncbi:MAG: RNA polymerase sigma factor [Deltaproteobacteria bacterium]|nr:RNA polymerase sigma factor [Deltaproteobacteria bacterium]